MFYIGISIIYAPTEREQRTKLFTKITLIKTISNHYGLFFN